MTKELSQENHIWLNSLSADMNEKNITELVYTTKELEKPEIDEAYDNGFDNGVSDGKIVVFRNMIKDAIPREKAQKYAEISDQLAELVLAEI